MAAPRPKARRHAPQPARPHPGTRHDRRRHRRELRPEPDPARRPARAASHHQPRRHARGRLLLAAREDRSRGDRLPRGRERLRRRGDAAARGASARRSTTRCSAASSRPTCRCPTARTAGSTTRAPTRACSTRSCAASAATDAPEQVLLDLNELAEGHRFIAVDDFEVSDDGRLLAYTTDSTGFRQYTLHVKDLETGAEGPERDREDRHVAWAADGQTLFYAVEDAAKRPYRGCTATAAAGPPATTRWSTRRRTSASSSRASARAAALPVPAPRPSHTTSEVRVLAASTPAAAWRRSSRACRTASTTSTIAATGSGSAPTTPGATSGWSPRRSPRRDAAHWREVVAHRDDVMLDGLDVLRRPPSCCGTRERRAAAARGRSTSPAAERAAWRSPSPRTRCSAPPTSEFDAPPAALPVPLVRHPARRCSTTTSHRGTRTLLKRTAVLGGYDCVALRDRAHRGHRARRHAGADLAGPPTRTCRATARRRCCSTATARTASRDRRASSPTGCSLLDRGVSSRHRAHPRRRRAGQGVARRRAHAEKMNTFTDFIACAEHLVRAALHRARPAA